MISGKKKVIANLSLILVLSSFLLFFFFPSSSFFILFFYCWYSYGAVNTPDHIAMSNHLVEC